MSTVNRTVPVDLSLDKRFLPLNDLETLNNSITEKLSLLAEVRIPFQGMNVEQHRSTGIGDICTVNASILSTCQTLHKKKSQHSSRRDTGLLQHITRKIIQNHKVFTLGLGTLVFLQQLKRQI